MTQKEPSGLRGFVRNLVLTETDKKALRMAREPRQFGKAYAGMEKGEQKSKVSKYSMSYNGVARDYNVADVRELAKYAPVRECINRIQSDVMKTKWDIIPKDPKNYNKDRLQKIKEFFGKPNGNKEGWNTIAGKVTLDILEIDSGILEKVWSAKLKAKKLVEIYARDGGLYQKNMTESGVLGHTIPHIAYSVEVNGKTEMKTEENKFVAYWQAGGTSGSSIPFELDDLIWFEMKPRTDNPYGHSPVQSVKQALQILLAEVEEEDKYYKDGAVPQGILGVKDIISEEEWKRFNDYVEKTQKDGTRKFYTVAADAKFTPFPASARDRQFLESQKWFGKMVHAIFNVPDNELGYTDDIQKGASDKQQSIYQQHALKPVLDLIAERINAELIPEFFKEESTDVIFKYYTEDLIELEQRAKIAETYVKNNLRTINELRNLEGLPPVPWGNIAPTAVADPQQLWQSYYFGAPPEFMEMYGIPAPKHRPQPQPVPQPTTTPQTKPPKPEQGGKPQNE